MAGRRPQLTGRAAVLAVVVCAIAMSLAYPVREYIAQRRQIAELLEERERELAALNELERRNRQLNDPGYNKQIARERLFFCDPGEKCFTVMTKKPTQKPKPGTTATPTTTVTPPWYETLWGSVEAADRRPTPVSPTPAPTPSPSPTR
ncbi:cell division protein FtsB [Thermocatellispora tengchongensis]|uniref:Cell division protein FtsB n=2 Tax=Thermocatellispora tengchongensis TaxID=1073253 RepID=A0A840NYX9_9ACTN|nr:septum formation initiator family protein [Thermocatellispora tengchongensis]MBB5134114.1 cell division protein FtsB [Thermocatellispora tengchongensis]